MPPRTNLPAKLERARRRLWQDAGDLRLDTSPAAEGGCGVVGLACDVPVAGRHLMHALAQMRNRGNGKGGGVAMVGLDAAQLGTTPRVLREDYLLGIAYLDAGVRAEVERRFLEPVFEIDDARELAPAVSGHAALGLEVRPPDVVLYWARPRAAAIERFLAGGDLAEGDFPDRRALEDELVYQSSFRLNRELYAGERGNLAYVQCHAKDLLVLKMVGYAEDVVRFYGLEDMTAHVWIGHHRYPTKGKVWHPGGAHPFVGLNEALVHNGDFANYQSICDYLAQRQIRPLFMTDTEVAALVFDLHRRTYGYPLEYVIESLAPTTERDFAVLPAAKQEVYRALQTTHIHGSPDGPWFFIIAESGRDAWRLIGVTDTSMLRPQVFAVQRGAANIAFCASEKQVIDAVLESLAAADPRFWGRPDRYWVARGGSHTDGGAFVFTLRQRPEGGRELVVTDKFGAAVASPTGGDTATLAFPNGGSGFAWRSGGRRSRDCRHSPQVANGSGSKKPAAAGLPKSMARRSATPEAYDRSTLRASDRSDAPGPFPARSATQETGPFPPLTQVLAALRRWSWQQASSFLDELALEARVPGREVAVLELLTLLLDRRYDPGRLRRSRWLSRLDACLAGVLADLERRPTPAFQVHAGPAGGAAGQPRPDAADQTIVLDARRYAIEGEGSAANELVALYRHGWRRFLVANTRGHRFLGCGFGPATEGVRIDVYGSFGDYLASGGDGIELHAHGDAQDQVAQIWKSGLLVVHGDVGQAFGYGAKGGEAYVLGSAAGRPMINAVGSPRVVINGTCLDYLAESFMAGDPLKGGGFVILNGVGFDSRGRLRELDNPYPGSNLFSLASGGALYIRDPFGRLEASQLNGGEFAELGKADWDLIRPYLEKNEAWFGIPVSALLAVDGVECRPAEVYRKVRPVKLRALQAEEAWVGHRG
ncbi:MAG TPA: glutamate synthase [Thermoanaerobaculia bacterium]|nr:glutamate synthase [Thermoanaerobaculia bacterium]